MSWTTNDELMHIKGLQQRAKAWAGTHGVTQEQYIEAYGEAIKKREDWGDIDKNMALFEFNKIKGAIQKRKVS